MVNQKRDSPTPWLHYFDGPSECYYLNPIKIQRLICCPCMFSGGNKLLKYYHFDAPPVIMTSILKTTVLQGNDI